jgi:hypothetical protein
MFHRCHPFEGHKVGPDLDISDPPPTVLLALRCDQLLSSFPFFVQEQVPLGLLGHFRSTFLYLSCNQGMYIALLPARTRRWSEQEGSGRCLLCITLRKNTYLPQHIVHIANISYGDLLNGSRMPTSVKIVASHATTSARET